MAYGDVITRANVPIPDQVVSEVIQAATDESIVLKRAKRARLSTKKATQPVLASLPEAFWVNGDTGLKQTTTMAWEGLSITAEELAALVPIPTALVDDASIPLWSEVTPRLAEAIGVKADLACLYGIDKPASFPVAILPGATAAGNTSVAGADLGASIAAMGRQIAADGFSMNGLVSGTGMSWALKGARYPNGTPADLGVSPLGVPMDESVLFPASTARLLGVDWKAHVVGVRQDITFDLFDQMVISDAAGKVIFNAAQQDSKVMRVVFRFGFQTAIPVVRGEGGAQRAATGRYPGAVLTVPTP